MEKERKRGERPHGKIQPEQLDILRSMSSQPGATDVLGSYTGTAADGGSPVQDADDL